jgi:cytochrome c-type biogenesis protein CcmE
LTPRAKRLSLVGASLAALGIAAWLILSSFQKNLVFFFTPSQVLSGEAPANQRLRLGGMVEPGSVVRAADGVTVTFVVTDTVQRLPVQYRGMLPDLFKEGKGVVAQGSLSSDRRFVADEVLAKHDENYMPPEAAHAIAQARQAKRAADTPTAAGGLK